MTEGAIKLSFDDKFLALTFDHECFNTLAAGNLMATNQINGLSIFEIEAQFAESTL